MMLRNRPILFYPEQILFRGSLILGLGFLIALPFLFLLSQSNSIPSSLSERKEALMPIKSVVFQLGLDEKIPFLPLPDLQGEITFSFDPPKPVGFVDEKRLLVRLKKSGDLKRVELPCRIDLQFQGDKLVFSKEEGSFWIELAETIDGQIEGKGFITPPEGGGRLNAGSFFSTGQESPILGSQELADRLPFRVLAESKWWGRDLFRESGDVGDRIELGNGELLELKEEEWLVWKGQKWEKSSVPEKDLPIVRIQGTQGKSLILEGWDSFGHARLSLALASSPPFKIKGEELFSSIRIRSEKQISCMLEKQCMVLKTGDWVLKVGGRWKVLRKKEERDAVLNGKMVGDLFVFDQISQKQGQKMIQGRLFNSGRTQLVQIELSGQSGRKGLEKGFKRGKV